MYIVSSKDVFKENNIAKKTKKTRIRRCMIYQKTNLKNFKKLRNKKAGGYKSAGI